MEHEVRRSCRSISRIVKLVGLLTGALLAIGLFGHSALADGPTVHQNGLTVQLPVRVGAGSAPSISVNAPAPASASASTSVQFNASSSASAQAGATRASAQVSAPTTVTTSARPAAGVRLGSGSITAGVQATAPSGAQITTPSQQTRPGSGLLAIQAPITAQVQSAPVAQTQLNAGPVHLNNATAAPAAASLNTCPLIGVTVRGYGCGNSGRAGVVAFAPTSLQAATAPVSTTHANILGNRVNNTTAIPAAANLNTCPLVGVAVRGYGCGNSGRAGVVAFAPTSLQAAAAPVSATHANFVGNRINNTTGAPVAANLVTCPLVGLFVRGYGCGNPGSAAAVIFAPTSAAVAASPVSATSANILGNRVNNTTAVPAAANLTTCPLVGLFVRGYGCGNPGSAAAVILAPTSAALAASPVSATSANILGIPVRNTTSAPTSMGLVTCPLIGLFVQGYGCGNPGSGTAVIFAPTSGTISSLPSSSTQVGSLSGTISAPTTIGITTCPLIGINVSGYGCGAPAPAPDLGAGNGGGTSTGTGNGGSGNPGSGNPPSVTSGGSTSGPNAGNASGSNAGSIARNAGTVPASLAAAAGNVAPVLPAPNSNTAPARGSGSGSPAAPAGATYAPQHGTQQSPAGPAQTGRSITAGALRLPSTSPIRFASLQQPVPSGMSRTRLTTRSASPFAGLARLPRTGGGRPVTPTLPFLPLLIALFLVCCGLILRRSSSQKLSR